MLSRPFILEMSYKLSFIREASIYSAPESSKDLRDSDEVLPKTIAMPRP